MEVWRGGELVYRGSSGDVGMEIYGQVSRGEEPSIGRAIETIVSREVESAERARSEGEYYTPLPIAEKYAPETFEKYRPPEKSTEGYKEYYSDLQVIEAKHRSLGTMIDLLKKYWWIIIVIIIIIIILWKK